MVAHVSHVLNHEGKPYFSVSWHNGNCCVLPRLVLWVGIPWVLWVKPLIPDQILRRIWSLKCEHSPEFSCHRFHIAGEWQVLASRNLMNHRTSWMVYHRYPNGLYLTYWSILKSRILMAEPPIWRQGNNKTTNLSPSESRCAIYKHTWCICI